jgi:DNA replication licensing factor MCM2
MTSSQLQPMQHAGVYTNTYDATLNVKNGFPVFSTLVEANHIQVQANTCSTAACSYVCMFGMQRRSRVQSCQYTTSSTMQKTEDVYATYKLTDEDLAEIHALARDPKIGAPALSHSSIDSQAFQRAHDLSIHHCLPVGAGERIARSIAPSIYGHGNIKEGIALAMFGGQVA